MLPLSRATPVLRGLKWPKVEELVAERDLVMVHRLLYDDNAPACLRNLMSYRGEVSSRETRSTAAGLLHMPRVRTEHARRSFRSRSAAKWNEAPGEVRDARAVAVFRTRMRKWVTANDKKVF